MRRPKFSAVRRESIFVKLKRRAEAPSLRVVQSVSASAAEVEFAWDAEIKRRLDEIDSGAVEMIPGEEVLARMDARLKAKRQQVAP